MEFLNVEIIGSLLHLLLLGSFLFVLDICFFVYFLCVCFLVSIIFYFIIIPYFLTIERKGVDAEGMGGKKEPGGVV